MESLNPVLKSVAYFHQVLAVQKRLPVGMVSAVLMLLCCVMETVIVPTGPTKADAVTTALIMLMNNEIQP